MSANRLPPANIEAERALLGAALIDPDVLKSVSLMVDVADFYVGKHGEIYSAMIDLQRQHTPIDFLTLRDHLERAGSLEMTGGDSYLAELINVVPSSIHASAYAASVQRAAWLRRMIDATAGLTKSAYAADADIDAVYDEAQRTIRELIPPTGQNEILYGWDVAAFLSEVLNESIVRKEEGKATLYDWPWMSWNQRILPTEGGILAMVTGAEASGKSTYLDHISEHWARNGLHVQLVHWEDSKRKKVRRRTTRHTGIEYSRIYLGDLGQDEQDTIHRRQAQIDATWGHRLHYLHARGRTLPQVLHRMAREITEGRCDALVVDYLNKIKRTPAQMRSGEELWQSWADMMDTLKEFAEEYDIPVITAGQMTKDGKSSLDLVGTGIRGSGEIVDKAQVVVNIFRPKLDSPVRNNGALIADVGDRSPHCEVGIVKQNDGTGGRWTQFFYGPLFRITDTQRGQS